MRVAHITDIHWPIDPFLRDLLSFRRVLGSLNLYLAGRGHHFSASVQQSLVEHVQRLWPDVLIVSGDLTAQGTEAEFSLAKRMLQPVLDSVPSLVIPGNHDAYAADTVRNGWMNKYFGAWRHMDGSVGRLVEGSVTVINGSEPSAMVAGERGGPRATACRLSPHLEWFGSHGARDSDAALSGRRSVRSALRWEEAWASERITTDGGPRGGPT